ncbi:ABC transporter substrate-binding protein [Enterovirga sp.]|jgi:branched-chain amino acid transport system substrate-binding protein|uniref:ABC transporter substrate-binding protein n=1 Tax=Enterovirga sp. TaxID=2026350 RepID=UPI00262098EC|nr:ABC transporter substrate-binding protein [Enterovirga sp.]MDB5590334.1 transporter substrate-binding protein [Enterovirga sp.]
MTKTTGVVGRRAFIGGMAAGAAITGFPHIAGAQAKAIRIGLPTILSGRVAILGTSSRAAVQLATQQVNDAGGIAGRRIEIVDRDSKGRPDEAARVTRDLINNDGCEIVIDGEASSGAFAVHEVVRDLGVLCLHTCSETSSLSADPKLFVKTAFRCARQGIHDAVAGGTYASEISKAKGLKKWATCSPDYAYGRDNTAEFVEYVKLFDPQIEVVDQLWPKLFAPDYTESITKMLQVKPQAVYSALWGGDLVAFIEQSNLYRLFANTAFFSGGLGDPPVLSAIKQLPPGLNTAYRYNRNYPANPENTAYADGFVKIAGHESTNWGWQNYLATQFIFEALRRTGGKTDGGALAAEIKGMTVKSGFGVDGNITMRESDHTIINYPVAWGRTVPKAPWVEGFQAVEWAKILELEQQWKKSKGYA